ncbi:MAG: hypothetical protein ACOYOV_00355 [Bacteroidales bacterium]
MKTCTKCKVTKNISEFQKDAKKSDGVRCHCKDCIKEYRKIANIRDKEKNSIRFKTYYEENKEVLLPKKTAYHRTHVKEMSIQRKQYRKENAGKMNSNKAKRRAAKLQRTPKWLTKEDFNKIKAIYMEAARLTKETGLSHQVDHILPILGTIVSGFHCPENLQILTKVENLSKSNKF